MSYNDWKNKQAFASAQQRWDDMLPEDEEGYYDDEGDHYDDDVVSLCRSGVAYHEDCLRYIEEDEYMNPYLHFDDEE